MRVQLVRVVLSLFFALHLHAAEPPLVQNDQVQVDGRTGVLIDVVANDQNPGGSPLFVINHNFPARGHLLHLGDGLFQYVPEANSDGSYSFSYWVENPVGNSVQGTVSLIVSGTDDGGGPGGPGNFGPPLRHVTGEYFFRDGNDNPILLSGSHIWNNFIDWNDDVGFSGLSNPSPEVFLDFLESYGHNFVRGWVWTTRENWWPMPSPVRSWTFEPLPWVQVGTNSSGRPVYDLNQINDAYLNRLRDRILLARERDIYVGVMLFQGINLGDKTGNSWSGDKTPWHFHPFNRENNVNQVDGDPNDDGNGWEIQTLNQTATGGHLNFQHRYLEAVIDKLHDLDNIIWEISNESISASDPWQQAMITYIRNYETTMGYPIHPIWHTAYVDSPSNVSAINALLEASSSEAVSYIGVGAQNAYKVNPTPAAGKKVSILDTDHIWGIGGYPGWVWKAFTRGHNPIVMDPKFGEPWQVVNISAADLETMRREMGQIISFSKRLDLAGVEIAGNLSETTYCLADGDQKFLVYSHEGGSFTVELPANTYNYEWFNPETGNTQSNGQVQVTGNNHRFTSPLAPGNRVVLFLTASGPVQQAPYQGNAHQLPGTIQAEHYDLGGEGIAYHDTSVGNDGNAFRNDDVDVQVGSAADNGYNVAYITADEWLEYSVDIQEAGSYNFLVRVAADPAGNPNGIKFSLELNQQTLGSYSGPATGGWQNWSEVTVGGVTLNAGPAILRVRCEALGWNLDRIVAEKIDEPVLISVSEAGGSGSAIADGSVYNGGLVVKDQEKSWSFRIRNDHNTNTLTLGQVQVPGTVWQVEQQPAGSIPAGGTSTFKVRYQALNVGNSQGSVTFSASQNGVQRTYNFDIKVETVEALSIDGPEDQEVEPGGSAVFSISATGGSGSYAYQWYRDSGAVISGATQAGLTLTNVDSADLGGYYCIVEDTQIEAASAQSRTAQLSFIGAANFTVTFAGDPIGDGQIIERPAIIIGTDPNYVRAFIKINYTGPAGGYLDWQVAPYPFGDNDWLVAHTLSHHLTQSNPSGSASFKPDTSSYGVKETTFRITSNDPGSPQFFFTLRTTIIADEFQIVQQPRVDYAFIGGQGEFQVVVAGGSGSFTYQWYRSDFGLPVQLEETPGYLEGVDQPRLVIHPRGAADFRAYSCKIVDAANSAVFTNSSAAALILAPAYHALPTTDSLPQTMAPGQTVQVGITFQNLGAVDWSQSGNITLQSVSGSDPFASSSHGLDPADLIQAPDSKTFVFNMTAPLTTGTFTTEWKMHHPGGFFGTLLSKTIEVKAPQVAFTQEPQNRVISYTQSLDPLTPKPGQIARSFSVEAQGYGAMSYRWYNADTGQALFDGSGTEFFNVLGSHTKDLSIYVGGEKLDGLPRSYHFYCIAQDGFSSARSNTVSLTLDPQFTTPNGLLVGDTFKPSAQRPEGSQILDLATEFGGLSWRTWANNDISLENGSLSFKGVGRAPKTWAEIHAEQFVHRKLVALARFKMGSADDVTIEFGQTLTTFPAPTIRLLVRKNGTAALHAQKKDRDPGYTTVVADQDLPVYDPNQWNDLELWVEDGETVTALVNGQVIFSGVTLDDSFHPVRGDMVIVRAGFGTEAGEAWVDDIRVFSDDVVTRAIAPTITAQPEDVAAGYDVLMDPTLPALGVPVNLRITADGPGPYSYQWIDEDTGQVLHNGVDHPDFSDIKGAYADNLNIVADTHSHQGLSKTYRIFCRVSNAYGQVRSRTATIRLEPIFSENAGVLAADTFTVSPNRPAGVHLNGTPLEIGRHFWETWLDYDIRLQKDRLLFSGQNQGYKTWVPVYAGQAAGNTKMIAARFKLNQAAWCGLDFGTYIDGLPTQLAVFLLDGQGMGHFKAQKYSDPRGRPTYLKHAAVPEMRTDDWNDIAIWVVDDREITVWVNGHLFVERHLLGSEFHGIEGDIFTLRGSFGSEASSLEIEDFRLLSNDTRLKQSH